MESPEYDSQQKIEPKHFARLIDSIKKELQKFLNNDHAEIDLEKEIRLGEKDFYFSSLCIYV